MTFSPSIAAVRFGSGLSPSAPPLSGAEALMAELASTDRLAQDYPVLSSGAVWDMHLRFSNSVIAKSGGDLGARDDLRVVQATRLQAQLEGFISLVQRGVAASIGFRERLQAFWANHFTVVDKAGIFPSGPTALQEDAIRPNLTGRFGDMLKAVDTHPVMLVYLDQRDSTGPNSEVGRKTGKGLNENLARELMELHSLGVGAPYTQTDVRQLALLMTGLGYQIGKGFVFEPTRAEQEPQTILGKRYGGIGLERINSIHAAMEDIAVRPETARHISQKLATHFVADVPDKNLVDHMTSAYSASQGDLGRVYAAMLEHPAAWNPERQKVHQPFDYIIAGLRALGVAPDALANLPAVRQRSMFLSPLSLMGQPFQNAPGPNGWPEAAAAWTQPALLAARIQWAMTVPPTLLPMLPDPRGLVQTALGDDASPDVAAAAAQAETLREGVGLVLASAEFNRR